MGGQGMLPYKDPALPRGAQWVGDPVRTKGLGRGSSRSSRGKEVRFGATRKAYIRRMIPAKVHQHLLREPRIAPLLDQLEVPERPDFGGDVYFGLQRSIAYQQLSGKAAGTIFGRFLQLFPDEYPHPDQLVEMEEELIRGAGMSRSKTAYVKNVAQYWLDHQLIEVNWDNYPDERILEMLTSIRGVGQWTVEMVLMFILQRPDLLPLDDLVVKRNIIKLFGVNTDKYRGKQLRAELLRVTEPWRPYRSYASRVMWALRGTET